jgi:phosphoglycerate dehydrogenase-like enzyme
MTGKILVTPRSLTAHPHPALAALAEKGFDIVLGPHGQQPDEAALLSLVPDRVGWIAGVEPASETVVNAAPMLRAVSRNGVGTDNLPALLPVNGRSAALAAQKVPGKEAAADPALPVMLLPASLGVEYWLAP